ncbi:DUF2760 domain-containing protein [Pseudobacteriovorax antillogorgiicola]|uniref:DUF2760 domain-containing protein n=1 Tax=Pseudobacteriovorax antillogorgiicola TaxID=1513793 RepID=A0A1Y6CFD8_9BACT|nr:DUF2760 domain-containing protein [Pseudobacteriovorax antillogorgiicola]TCS51716.1 uncharacterized protein DUF2760 [Pseudobacteriovorax antillogorgiicola]SMF49383.1 protein of unknown function [Pseudobacteriovorax antillogorgiicola]
MVVFLLSFLSAVALSLNLVIPDAVESSLASRLPWIALGGISLASLASLQLIWRQRTMKDMAARLKNYQDQTIQDNHVRQTLAEELKTAKDQLEAAQSQSMELSKKISTAAEERQEVYQKFEEEAKRRLDLERQAEQQASNSGEGDVITLLSTLQKKGRFIDFVMGDISQYPDAQVGAAARVVHSGCKKALQEFLDIAPIHNDAEGSLVALATDDADQLYRFSGRQSETIPSQGRLVHKGWKTNRLSLPRRTTPLNPDNMIIMPAEVEL